MKKSIIESKKNSRNFDSVPGLFVIYTCIIALHLFFESALFYMKNALVINQSEAHNFFMYINTSKNTHSSERGTL